MKLTLGCPFVRAFRIQANSRFVFHGQGYRETKMQSNSEGRILIGRFIFMANPLFIRNLISEPHTRKADTNPVILVSRTVQAGNTKLPGIAGYE